MHKDGYFMMHLENPGDFYIEKISLSTSVENFEYFTAFKIIMLMSDFRELEIELLSNMSFYIHGHDPGDVGFTEKHIKPYWNFLRHSFANRDLNGIARRVFPAHNAKNIATLFKLI